MISRSSFIIVRLVLFEFNLMFLNQNYEMETQLLALVGFISENYTFG